MTLQNKKRVLMLLAMASCASAIAVLRWGWMAPQIGQETDNAVNAKPEVHVAQKPVVANQKLAADNFSALWERPLRRPLFDPPPPPPKPVQVKTLPPVRAKLLATMIEPENSMAMLRLGTGEVVFRKVGEAIGKDEGEARISGIEPGKVIIRRGAEETRLSID